VKAQDWWEKQLGSSESPAWWAVWLTLPGEGFLPPLEGTPAPPWCPQGLLGLHLPGQKTPPLQPPRLPMGCSHRGCERRSPKSPPQALPLTFSSLASPPQPPTPGSGAKVALLLTDGASGPHTLKCHQFKMLRSICCCVP
jgi:hypothetical protein